jgi:hypothetical protein
VTHAFVTNLNQEWLPREIWPPLVNGHEHNQKLIFIGRELLVDSVESLTEECNWVSILGQYNSYPFLTHISLNSKLKTKIW